MAFLLDTTVLIDVARGQRAVSAWFAAQDLDSLWLSTITVGELHRGLHQRLRAQPEALAAALGQLREDTLLPFEGRILSLDIAAAEIWGRLMGEGAARGQTPPTDDAKIARSRSVTGSRSSAQIPPISGRWQPSSTRAPPAAGRRTREPHEHLSSMTRPVAVAIRSAGKASGTICTSGSRGVRRMT
jgi:predicted nucleic acid-binding protein